MSSNDKMGFNNGPGINEVNAHSIDVVMGYLDRQVARVAPMMKPNVKKRPATDDGHYEAPTEIETVQNSNKVIRQSSMQNVRDANGSSSNGANEEPMEQDLRTPAPLPSMPLIPLPWL